MNPAWSKGYARKGAALHGARRYDDAIAAYEAGLAVENSPALRKGLDEVKAAKGMCYSGSTITSLPDIHNFTIAAEESDGGGAFSMGKMFQDPNLIAKLAANPRTQKHLADASFMQKVWPYSL